MNIHLVRLTALFGILCVAPSFAMHMAYTYRKNPIKINSINISDNSARVIREDIRIQKLRNLRAKEINQLLPIHRSLLDVAHIFSEAAAYQIQMMKRDTRIANQQAIDDVTNDNEQILIDLMDGINPLNNYLNKCALREIDDYNNTINRLAKSKPYVCPEKKDTSCTIF